jgi:hypothetical protein
MPYPNGRETKAERHYAKCRGPLGFHVLTGPSSALHHKVPRELARSLWKAGYDVSCEIDDTGEEGWGRTSIRHLEGMVKQPFVSLSWGRVDPSRMRDFQGQARVEIDSIDTGKWKDTRDVRYINERVDLLIVPGQSSVDAYRKAGVDIPIEIVPFGVDTTVYQPWPKDEELLSKVVFPGKQRVGETLFLAEGSSDPRKGTRECVEAFRAAVADGLQASLVLLCQGGYPDLGLLDAASDLPLGLLHGPLDEWSMARLYSSVDFFIARYEEPSTTTMRYESMACGTLVVSSVEEITHQRYLAEKYVNVKSQPARELACHRSWEASATDLVRAVEKHISPTREGQRPPVVLGETSAGLRASHPAGDIGEAVSRLKGKLPLFTLRQSGIRFEREPLPDDGVTIYAAPRGSWTEPIEQLGLDGAPFAAVHLGPGTEWPIWNGGYYPRGLGIVDVVLWQKSHGVDVATMECECEVTGDPPWYDGASGQAEAEERLKAHLAELNFWWADLLHHIKRTGWW